MKAKNRLRVWRAERHITQLRLAKKAGLHTQTLSYIENGHIQATDQQRRVIAKALGVSVQDVFPETEAVAS